MRSEKRAVHQCRCLEGVEVQVIIVGQSGQDLQDLCHRGMFVWARARNVRWLVKSTRPSTEAPLSDTVEHSPLFRLCLSHKWQAPTMVTVSRHLRM